MTYESNNYPRYIRELSFLLTCEVDEKKIINLEKAESYRKDSYKINNEASQVFTIPFSMLSSKKFSDYIMKLYEEYESNVLLWTSLSNVFGPYMACNIKTIDFAFPFDLNDGVIAILSADCKEKMLLDFYEDANVKLVELTVTGENWGNNNLSSVLTPI